MVKDKIYFSNLNSFRFIAAFFVIIHHLELFLIKNKYLDNYSLEIIRGGGQVGVTFFFVLSGFLITYLLFRENEITKNISIKHFYIRRILRIWPLYYLLVILGFFVFPCLPYIYENLHQLLYFDFNQKLIEFILFIPNLTLAKFNEVPFASHLWSIGVEEQFYLIWPILIKFSKNKLKVMIYIILIMVILKSQYYILNNILSLDLSYSSYFQEFLKLTRIECMAIGGIGAYILFYKKINIINFIFKKWFQFFTYTIILFLICFNVLIPFLHNYIYSVLFIILILNISTNKASIINLEYKPLKYLGKISYGLYMYHPICIAISFWIMETTFNYSNGISSFDVFFLLTITCIITILISAFSFHYFESKLLNLKPYFFKTE